MAKAQPARALANYLENLRQQEGSSFLNIDEAGGKNIAFLNAQVLPGTVFDDAEFCQTLICEQSFKPLYLQLKQAELNVFPEIAPVSEEGPAVQQNDFSACLILAGKFKALNQHMIDRAHEMTTAGGPIIVAGGKTSGISSLRKRAAGTADIINSLSKFHSVVFELQSMGRATDRFVTRQRKVNSDRHTYITASGLFSSDTADEGSRILADHFSNNIKGTVADLGAGWGYLSAELLLRSKNITELDLYEADWNGVKISRQNLLDISGKVETGFNWHDVTCETIAKRYNWVIMNPPFHTGRDTSTELGQKFIQTASRILKPRGNLLMVANRHLAYEATLARYFSAFRILEHKAGFKIISAQI